MEIYLDACSLQRPLDDRSQARINIEAEAILTVLRLVETKDIKLLSSEALTFELSRIPDSYRRIQALRMLELAEEVIEINDSIEAQADLYTKSGIKPMDALHLASAYFAGADYFCTCDDKLLRNGKRIQELSEKILSPLQLVAEVAQ